MKWPGNDVLIVRTGTLIIAAAAVGGVVHYIMRGEFLMAVLIGLVLLIIGNL